MTDNKKASENDRLSPDSTPLASFLDIERFRRLVKIYIDRHQYLGAEFWANKLVTLTKGQTCDVHSLAQCYFLTRQYHRAILLITSHKLLKNPKCRYLAARCHYEVGEYQTALDVLDHLGKTSITKVDTDDATSRIESSIHLLRGYIHEAADNRTLAMESFRIALQHDPLCYEAFHALTQHHMLSTEEEKELLGSLPLAAVCNLPEESIIRHLYENLLNKYSEVKPSTNTVVPTLTQNLDVRTAEAENLYYKCDFTKCFKLTQRILQHDPYHPSCITIHIACLVELKQANTLFLLGHKLVDLYPESALSWFAVGCYYYLIGKNDHARRFLSKATTLDRVLGPAWIAYGHSFAAENEHDQARAAYYKAAQLMKGCHLPLLYIGMEYSLTNNSKFAEKFFNQAQEIAPNDPFVHHEMGVVAYTNQDYSKAETCFKAALQIVEDYKLSAVPEKWATLLQNLGLTCCKLGHYYEAFRYLRFALRLNPGSATTYAIMGLVHAYMEDYQDAIVSLHKALSLQKDHTVASSLLSSLMNQVVVHSSVFEGDSSVLAFDLVSIESTTGNVAQNRVLPSSSNSMDELKNILGTSIGKPMMHSSDLAGQTPNQTPQSNDTSAMVIEDMIMDDESP